jgi:putative ABC transport system permease protein
MIDGSDFLVIGVVEKPKGGIGMGDEDRRVLIPFSTFHKIYPMADELNIRMQAYPKVLDQAVDQAREVLERRRKVPYGGKDNFSIETAEQQVQEFHNIVGMVALAMVVLSSIGLLVGGIGVMNIMLVSVTERTREIGVRKAIGAKRSNILSQFLIEAVTLSGVGGVIGVLFGSSLSLLMRYGLRMPAVLSFFWIATALIMCALIGIVFGVYPAWKAARLDPVEALRYE